MNTLSEISQTDDITVLGISSQSRLKNEALTLLAKGGYPVSPEQDFDKIGLIDLRGGDQGVPLVLLKAKGARAIAEKRLLLGKNFSGIITGTDTALEVALMRRAPLYQVIKTGRAKSRMALMTSQSTQEKTKFFTLFTKYPAQAEFIIKTMNIRVGSIVTVESDAEVLAASATGNLALDIIESGSSRDANNLKEIQLPKKLEALTQLQMGAFELEEQYDLPSPIQNTLETLWKNISDGVIERKEIYRNRNLT